MKDGFLIWQVRLFLTSCWFGWLGHTAVFSLFDSVYRVFPGGEQCSEESAPAVFCCISAAGIWPLVRVGAASSFPFVLIIQGLCPHHLRSVLEALPSSGKCDRFVSYDPICGPGKSPPFLGALVFSFAKKLIRLLISSSPFCCLGLKMCSLIKCFLRTTCGFAESPRREGIPPAIVSMTFLLFLGISHCTPTVN